MRYGTVPWKKVISNLRGNFERFKISFAYNLFINKHIFTKTSSKISLDLKFTSRVFRLAFELKKMDEKKSAVF